MKYISVLLLMSTVLFSASFDCKKANTITEKAVCSNKELSKLDSKLGILYESLVQKYGGLPEKPQEQFIKNQKHWLEYVRDKTLKVQDLIKIYKKRVSYLEAQLIRLPDEFFILTNQRSTLKQYVFIMHDTNYRMQSFNNSARLYFKHKHEKEMQVLDCNTLLMIAVGVAHGNRSYGGGYLHNKTG
jgi:uncharacterized protein